METVHIKLMLEQRDLLIAMLEGHAARYKRWEEELRQEMEITAIPGEIEELQRMADGWAARVLETRAVSMLLEAAPVCMS